MSILWIRRALSVDRAFYTVSIGGNNGSATGWVEPAGGMWRGAGRSIRCVVDKIKNNLDRKNRLSAVFKTNFIMRLQLLPSLLLRFAPG